jgi:hypothetical protein
MSLDLELGFSGGRLPFCPSTCTVLIDVGDHWKYLRPQRLSRARALALGLVSERPLVAISICPSCFGAEAERAGVRYRFANVRATSWSDIPEPPRRYGRRPRQDRDDTSGKLAHSEGKSGPGSLTWRLQLFVDLLIPAVHRGNANTAQPPRPPRPSLSICCHHADDPKVAACALEVRAEIAIHVAIRQSVTFLMNLPHFAGLLLWQCTQQRGKCTPALTRYFPIATIQASNWWFRQATGGRPVRDAPLISSRRSIWTSNSVGIDGELIDPKDQPRWPKRR